MATKIITPDPVGDRFVLTSILQSIKATTDKDCVDVSMTCEAGLNGAPETFYSATLDAFDRVVEIFDAAVLIEDYFRMRQKVADIVTVTFDDVAVDIPVVYCEYAMSDSFDPENTFFIASAAQRVHCDSIVAIAGYNHGYDTPFIIRAVGHREADGRMAVVEKSEFRDLDQENTTYFHVADIIKWALNQSELEAGEDLRDVMYFSIGYAGAQKMCYLVPDPAYLTFSFRNIFNVREYIDVVGEITTKTDVSCEMAECNRVNKQYDRKVSRTYQVQTAPLTADEIPVLEQFIASHAVCLFLDGTEYEVIITDHTCEPSTDDEALTTISFTWRFAARRPRIFDSGINGIMAAGRNIFDNTYSSEYE